MRIRSANPVSSQATASNALIDVVFLLLIFFLCATRFRMPEGALDSFLPRDRGTASSLPDTVVPPCRIALARVDGEIRCRVDDRSLPAGTPEELERYTGVPGPDFDELERHLRGRIDTTIEPLQVVIDAQLDVPAKYVVGIVDRCVKLRISDVSLVEYPVDFD